MSTFECISLILDFLAPFFISPVLALSSASNFFFYCFSHKADEKKSDKAAEVEEKEVEEKEAEVKSKFTMLHCCLRTNNSDLFQ
jgi:phosphate/sulfate permease